jgi:nitrate/nitrite transporter NarK
MGFTNMQAQLLVAPPYVWAAIPALSTAFLADRVRNCRGVAVTINALCVIMGTAMYSQLPATQKAARYAGVFLALGGCNSNVPLVISWAQTSIRSQSKRGFTSALVVAWGGVGGIISSVAFQQKEAKQGYPTGVFLTIAMNAVVIVLCGVLNRWYAHQNKKADRGEVILEDDVHFRYQS